MPSNTPPSIRRARNLRDRQTPSEGLLWSTLRAGQLSELKFRRQHPIGPFYADFACPKHRLVIEIDGGYHDAIQEEDMARQRFIEQQSWTVLRFTDKDVMDDVEVVLLAICQAVGVPMVYRKRTKGEAGLDDRFLGKG